ncbi:hypothetical protein HII17_03195 [Thalassotalea sp. M1531]|uniref:Uncharacterized protein n=1 Tax=Thalassotalea algicola TaxID=2716224 RepID=A0A7Y0Q510_9GAMM|nr:hypothetical protein [Thalassotalea algicola]NMP30559.1 hypothetical protein [Thalassotalea algicola]
MKNLLILIVFAAVYLHFYPQPELTQWYNEQKETALEIFSDATDTKVRLKSDRIYKDLESRFDEFRDSEIKYLEQITSSRSSVKEYYTDFCSGKRDSKFHVKNQKLVCQTISQYTGLF